MKNCLNSHLDSQLKNIFTLKKSYIFAKSTDGGTR